MTRNVFVYSDQLSRFRAYDGYPWLFERSDAVLGLCRQHGLMDRDDVALRGPIPVSDEALRTFHDGPYLETLAKANDGTFEEEMLMVGLGTIECPVYRGCFDYHRLVVGSTLAGAAAICEPDVSVAFVPTAGMHHAGPDFASGFCYLNDAVIGIKDLLARGLRVLYVDIDAHHGDLVQAAFYEEPRVLKVSFHESPETLFPFHTGFAHEMGAGAGEGYNVNVPLPAGAGDEAYRVAFEGLVPSLAAAFEPDVVVATLGADALASDPLTHLMLTTEGYCHLVGWLGRLAPKVLALGSGGYLLNSVARALTLAFATLVGEPIHDDAELLFGGVFRGDGLVSLHDLPIYVPEQTRREAHAAAMAAVEHVGSHQLQVLVAAQARR